MTNLPDTLPKETDLVRLGDRIKERRLELDLSSRELAKASRLSPSYISILERGLNPKTQKPTRPKPAAIRSIALALQLPSRELLLLAGHLQEGEVDEAQVEPFARSVAQESPPSVLVDLLEMERDYARYIEHHPVTQTPVLIFLHALEKRPDLRVVGITFGAMARPARLVSLDRNRAADPTKAGFWAGLHVSVLGKYMGANALLLDYLRRQGFGLELRDEIAVATAEGKDPVEVSFAYSTESQLQLLRHGAHDLAFLPDHPYVDRQLDLHRMKVAEIDFDPWEELRQANLPLNVLVTTEARLTDASTRRIVQTTVEEIRLENRLVKSAQQHAILEAIEADASPPTPAIDLNEDVYIDDREHVAASLAAFSALGARVELTRLWSTPELTPHVVNAPELRAESTASKS